MNIILSGLPSCGKTTYAKKLAKKLNFKFIDTDDLIEKLYQKETKKTKTCREIYLEIKEKNFRLLEKKAILSLADYNNAVIALGGGAFYFVEEISKFLKSIGKIVYLKANDKDIFNRLLKKGLPAYLEKKDPIKSFQKLIKKRKTVYESISDILVETTLLSDDEIINYIIKKTKLDKKKH